MAETYRLRLYEDDGITIAAEFSTDPAHAHPYLRVPEQFAPQEINFAEGRATIGTYRVELVDFPVTPGDQDTGYVTSILADASGYTARIGRRAHLEVLAGAAYANVVNGVIDSLSLHELYSSYPITIKDQRETERQTRAFLNARTSSILPRGIIAGFGAYADGSGFLVPPVTPLAATYLETTEVVDGESITLGVFYLPFPAKDEAGTYLPPAEQVVTDAMEEQLLHTGSDNRYDRVRVLWDDGTNIGVLEGVLRSGPTPHAIYGGSIVNVANGHYTNVRWMQAFYFTREAGQVVPANDTPVDVIFGYDGPPSEDYPLHFEGPLGDLAAAIMDGTYSEEGAEALTLYDPAAVAAMTEPVLMRVTEPLDTEDGVWKWMEENIYAPFGRAPALDADGLISPVAYAMPPVSGAFVEFDDTNCEPVPGWAHTGSDAINVVSVEYQRLFRVDAERDPNGTRSAGDGLAVRTVVVEHRNIASIALLGERPLRIKAVTLCAIGGVDGEPVSGEVANEYGAQMSALRTREATDRFLFGGQHLSARPLRSAVGELRVGQWIVGKCSWWPDYVTGERGPDRLAQIVRLQVIDSKFYEVELIDAGPDGAAVGAPTLDDTSVVVHPDGSVTFDVTAVAAASEARIDYALSTLEPAEDSAEWRFVAPRLTAPGGVTIPPNPSGSTIWVRGRGEKEGRRPSDWTTAFDVVLGAMPRILTFGIIRTTGGELKATWTKNTATAGMRIYYQSHAANVAPSPTLYVSVDADDLEYTFDEALTDADELFTVQMVPYSGWTGAVVSGTAGASLQRTVAGTPPGDEDNRAPALEPKTISENQGTMIATFGVIVRNPSALPTRLLYKKRIGGAEWDTTWTEKEADPVDGDEYTETVAMVQGHPSGIMFGLEYELPDSDPLDLPIFTLESPAFDPGLIANVTGADIAFSSANKVQLNATGDFDTRDDATNPSLIMTATSGPVEVLTMSANASAAATSLAVEALAGALRVGTILTFASGESATVTAAAAAAATSVSVAALAVGINDGDTAPYGTSALPATPTLGSNHGSIKQRSGIITSTVTCDPGHETSVIACAVNENGDVGPAYGPYRKINPGTQTTPGGSARVVFFYAVKVQTPITTPTPTQNQVKVNFEVTGDAGTTITLNEYDTETETDRDILTDDATLVRTDYAFDVSYTQAAKTDSTAVDVQLAYRLIVKNAAGDTIAHGSDSVLLTYVAAV